MKYYYFIQYYDARGFQYILFENRGEAAQFHRMLKERAKPYDVWVVRTYTENEWFNLASCRAYKFTCRLGETGKAYKVEITRGF